MSTETKFFIAIGTLTVIAIIFGAIFLSNKNSKDQTSQTLGTVDQNELVANARHTIGDINAPVQIVEFADLQCPACKSAHPIVKTILETKGESIYYVFRHYPLSIHKNAKVAAKAAEAAGLQEKFFEMENLLFERQKDWENSGSAKEIFENYAQELELDTAKFKDDFDKGTGNINSDFSLGNKSGVTSTPTFFVNGQKYPGVINLQQFEQIIDTIVGPAETTSTSETPNQQPAQGH